MKDQPITLPCDPESHIKHAYHLYTILVDDIKSGISRDKLIVELFNNNIGSGVHYLSIPEHPYYRRTFGWKCEDYPIAMKIGRQTVSIPLSPKLSDSEAERIAGKIIEILQGERR